MIKLRRLGALVFFVLLFSIPASAFGGGFVDDSGREISFNRPFTRIISLYGAHTENLFSLGLDQEIIGVSTSEDHPPEALAKPTFHYRDGLEKFLAARPDLVLIRPMIFHGYRRLVDRLEEAGVKVVSLQPKGVEDLPEYWLRLGRLSGREAEATRMIADFEAGLAELRARTSDIPDAKRPRVFFEAIHSKMKTFSPTAMAVFALQWAGGVNAAPDAQGVRGTNIAEYGKEKILSIADRIDVYLVQIGPMNQVNVETILDEPGFRAIKAVRNGRVYLVDERLVSRPTLRLLEGASTIGALLYPDRFDPPEKAAR